jgi:uncharacterized protein YjbJ (UPF0337 family)
MNSKSSRQQGRPSAVAAQPLLHIKLERRGTSNVAFLANVKGTTMDKEHVKGAYEKTKGAVKDTIGKVTGDKKRQAEGKVDKAKGSARQAAGDLKDAARKATKHD